MRSPWANEIVSLCGPRYAAHKATTLKGIASLKLDSDPLGSHFANDSADALDRVSAKQMLLQP